MLLLDNPSRERLDFLHFLTSKGRTTYISTLYNSLLQYFCICQFTLKISTKSPMLRT